MTEPRDVTALSWDELCNELREASWPLLSPPDYITRVWRDLHLPLWSWVGQICVTVREGVDRVREDHREALRFGLLAVLSQIEVGGRVGHERLDRLLETVHSWVAYIALPVLEGMLRVATARFVDLDGVVQHDFAVSGRNYRVGGRCNRLEHLLNLGLTEAEPAALRDDLGQLVSHLAGFGETRADGSVESGVEVLSRWRNGLVHGETYHFNLGPFVLTWALLIELRQHEQRFDEFVGHALGLRGWPRSFFPPVVVRRGA